MPVHAAFPDALGIYQVGSSLQRPDLGGTSTCG